MTLLKETNSKKKRVLSFLVALIMFLGFVAPTTPTEAFANSAEAHTHVEAQEALSQPLAEVTPPAESQVRASSVIDTVAGTNTYSLFNSGCTSSGGRNYSGSSGADYNPDSYSYNNNGYDIYGDSPSGRVLTVGMGVSFNVSGVVTERATLTVYAYDIDEPSQMDYVYLVDETLGSRTSIGNLTGLDERWSTTTIYIDGYLFTPGHNYHFENDIDDGGWWTWIRTVSLQMTINGDPNAAPSVPTILSHDFEATVSSSGLVSTSLYLQTSVAMTYTLEYTANIASTQRGGTQGQTITVTTAGASKQTSFQIESGAPKGVYLIVVILKDSLGNTVASYQASAGYDFCAVSYNANGGSNNLPIDANAYSSGSSVTVLFNYTPSKRDHEFLGWSTNPNATEPEFVANGNKTFTMGSGDVVLYAVWEYTPSTGGPQWGGGIADEFTTGSGTEQDPYLISSAEELALLATTTNNGDTHEGEYFKLTSDIDLENIDWVPIGITNMNGWEADDYYVGFANYFAGHFDGDNHTVYNLTQTECYYGRTGLFGCLKGATVKNLAIAHAHVSVDNVYDAAMTIGSKNTVAGVLAGTALESTVSECFTTGVLDVYHLSQGAGSAVGGLIGIINDTRITDCFSEVKINVKNGESAAVKSYNAYVGGMVGEAEGEIEIRNCYYNGDITVTTAQDKTAYVSGIIGLVENVSQASVIDSSFAIGYFTVAKGISKQASIYQYWDTQIQISDCFYNVVFCDAASKNIDENVALYQLQTQSFIESNLGWDFNGVWQMDNLTCYPVLKGFNLDLRADFIHVESDWIIDYEPTCEAQGKKHTECLACGAIASVASIAPTGHSYEAVETHPATCTADGYEVLKCSCCDKEITRKFYKTGHSYGNDNVCDSCGHTVEIHTHSYTVSVVDPTCSHVGYTLHQCTCGYSYQTDFVSEYGHRWDDGAVSVEETCTTNGILVYTCQECSVTRTESIKGGHKFTESIVIDATCTEDGIKKLVCQRCNEVRKEIIPAGHTWDTGVTVVEATCETAGTVRHTCSACGEVKEFEISKLGHRFVNGVCTECNKGFIEVVTPNEDHPSGVYFEIDDIISNYGSEYVNEYGALLDYNQGATMRKIAVYLTQDGTMWRRTIACVGSNIEYATFVPYLSYDQAILYSGLNSGWINTFSLRPNSDGIWCYSNYATIGANLQDAQGNLLLSLYDIGQAGAQTRIFDDLSEMIEWLSEPYDCINHVEGDWTVSVEPKCNAVGEKQIKCTDCGKVLKVAEIPATGICVADDWIIDTPATCTINGERHRNCKFCSVELDREVIIAQGHVEGQWEIVYDATCEEDGLKHVKCSTCGIELMNDIIPAHGHEESDWIISLYPTCTERGSRYKECTICHTDLATERLPATGHTESSWIVVDPENCGENGEKVIKCTVCHTVLQRDVIPATGDHAPSDWTLDYDATCEDDGLNYKYCLVCGQRVAEEVIPATGHTEGEWTLDYDATCEEDGLKYKSCTVCGDRVAEEVIPAIGHTEGEWIVDVDATCTQEGSKHKECTVCGDILATETIEKTPHTESDWIVDEEPTCLEKGSKHKECTECAESLQTEEIDANGHTESDWIVDEEPTCTETGTHHTVCTVCGDRVRVESIPENGHTQGDWTVDLEPTCTSNGSRHANCTVCGSIVVTEAIESLGHDHGDWQTAVAPTTASAGERYKQCSRCTHRIVETVPMLAKVFVSSAEAGVGEFVQVTVSMENNHGFVGATLTVEYEDGLELIGVEFGDVFSSLNVVHPTTLNSGCSFVWSGDSADSANGVIFTLTFRVSCRATLGEGYGVNVTYAKEDMLFTNDHCVDLHVEAGEITANALIGDVNSDGIVDVADVMAIRYYLAGGYGVEINFVQSDLNQDGSVNVADVVLLRNLIVNGEISE